MINVLIASQHFYPENFRINDIAHSLLASGCQVDVLTGKPNYPNGKIYSFRNNSGALDVEKKKI